MLNGWNCWHRATCLDGTVPIAFSFTHQRASDSVSQPPKLNVHPRRINGSSSSSCGHDDSFKGCHDTKLVSRNDNTRWKIIIDPCSCCNVRHNPRTIRDHGDFRHDSGFWSTNRSAGGGNRHSIRSVEIRKAEIVAGSHLPRWRDEMRIASYHN